MPAGEAISLTVSVALCTHNGEPFLVRQLRSIAEQSHPIDELIISDDASTDNTLKIISETIHHAFSSRAAPIAVRVLRNPVALGVTANFESAIRTCSGSVILLSDQDDIWHADRVEQMLKIFESSPDVLLAHSDARLVDRDGQDLGLSLLQGLGMTRRERSDLEGGSAFDALLGRNLVTGATVGFRRSLLEIALPFPLEWLHDEWLAILAASRGGMRLIPSELIDYRQHDSNQVGVRPLTFRGKLAKLTEPRGDRNLRLARRAEVLVYRLVEIGDVSAGVLNNANRKRQHELARSVLPNSRLLRVPSVLREALTGKYGRYGRGATDIARDLIQPA